MPISLKYERYYGELADCTLLGVCVCVGRCLCVCGKVCVCVCGKGCDSVNMCYAEKKRSRSVTTHTNTHTHTHTRAMTGD